MLLTIDPHIRITLQNESNVKIIESEIKQYVDKLSIHESSLSKVIVGHQSTTQAGLVMGIDSLHSKKQVRDRVSIGIGLADKLGVKKGDTITLSTPAMIDIAISGMSMPLGISVKIDSIFQISSGVQYDNSFIMADLQFLRENGLSGKRYADIRIENPDAVNDLVMLLRNDETLKSLHIDTWKDLHHDLYATMEFERNMSFIILGIISCVSAFNILIAMWMMVKSKSKDIAMLLSMGTLTKDIQWTFLLQGLIIGSLGTFLGAGLGIGLCYGQEHFGWVSLPNSIVASMPVSLSYDIVIVSIFLGLTVSILAGVYPSYLATRTNISEQLRHE